MIDLPTDITDALLNRDVRFAWLVYLPLGLKWTTHEADLSLGEDHFEANGLITQVPETIRARELRQHGVRMDLSGIDATRYSMLTEASVAGQPFQLDLVLLDANGAIIGNQAVTLYRGFVDRLEFIDSGKSDTIRLHINGPWYKPSQTAGRQTTDGSHRALYADDAFFSFAHEKYDNLLWGKEG